MGIIIMLRVYRESLNISHSILYVPFADVTNNTQLMYLDCSDRGFDGDDFDLDFSLLIALPMILLYR